MCACLHKQVLQASTEELPGVGVAYGQGTGPRQAQVGPGDRVLASDSLATDICVRLACIVPRMHARRGCTVCCAVCELGGLLSHVGSARPPLPPAVNSTTHQHALLCGQ
jgi:hypothetical protein